MEWDNEYYINRTKVRPPFTLYRFHRKTALKCSVFAYRLHWIVSLSSINEDYCIGEYYSVYIMPFSYESISIPFSYEHVQCKQGLNLNAVLWLKYAKSINLDEVWVLDYYQLLAILIPNIIRKFMPIKSVYWSRQPSRSWWGAKLK